MKFPGRAARARLHLYGRTSPTLLPTTDLIAFVWDLSGNRKTALISWSTAASIVGHYFKATEEDPPRTRVDDYPTPDELVELQKYET